MVDKATQPMSPQTASRQGHPNAAVGGRSIVRRSLEDMPSERELPDIWQLSYAALAIAATVIYLSSWYTWPEFTLPLKLFFLAVFVLTLRMWTVPIILVLIQVQILTLGRWFQDYSVGFSGVFWLLIPLAFISLISRYRTLQELHGDSSQTLLKRIKTLAGKDNPRKSDTLLTNVRGLLRQLLRLTVVLSACLVGARIILNLVPLPANPAEFDPVKQFRLTPQGFRLLTLNLGLFVTWLLAWLVVNERVWQSRSPAQAAVYLRSLFLDANNRDLRAIVRRRLKLKKKQTQHVNSVSDQPRETEPASEENPDGFQRML